MIEVPEVENLQIETVGTRLLPALHCLRASATTPAIPCSRNSSGWRSMAADRRRNSASSATDGDDEGGGEGHRRRISADCSASVENTLTLFREIIDRAEAEVEFAGESGGQAWRPALPSAADDDREVAALSRLRQRRRVGQLVVPAGEAEVLARSVSTTVR